MDAPHAKKQKCSSGRLSGKKIFMTAAAQGIGRASAIVSGLMGLRPGVSHAVEGGELKHLSFLPPYSGVRQGRGHCHSYRCERREVVRTEPSGRYPQMLCTCMALIAAAVVTLQIYVDLWSAPFGEVPFILAIFTRLHLRSSAQSGAMAVISSPSILRIYCSRSIICRNMEFFI